MFAALLVAAGSSAWFVISTITLDELPDAALMAAALLVALAFVSAFAGTPDRDRIAAAGRHGWVSAALGGGLAWAASPLLVFSQRSTDAPSGSETLFLTTAAWGALCVMVAFADRTRRPTWSQPAGALLALLGAAVILANWERPSSFSPFIKFPLREALFLVAGVLFAAGTLLLIRSAKTLGTRTALWIALAAALVLSALMAPFSGLGEMPTWVRLWPQVLLLGAALGSFAVGWIGLTSAFGLARPASLLFIPPLAISGLAALERALGVYGPNPIVWLAASAGAVLLVAGAALVWGIAPPSSDRAAGPLLSSHSHDPALRGRLGLAVLAIAGVSTALGAVTLALPAFAADVDAALPGGEAFRASWTMLGFESAAGWLALFAGLLALAGVLDLRRGRDPKLVVWTALTGLLAVASYPLLVTTPLHTWNQWIPAEVQQSYGTEYAHLNMNAVPDSLRYVALALSLLSCCTLIVYALRSTRLSSHAEAAEEETG